MCSFDKRGVGRSTGRWQEAGIEAQADDALAAVAAIRSEAGVDVPIGLFGHSQGGWVVVEAASRRAGAAFVVSNSGPGVSPGEQERYATRTLLERGGSTSTEISMRRGATTRWSRCCGRVCRSTRSAAGCPRPVSRFRVCSSCRTTWTGG